MNKLVKFLRSLCGSKKSQNKLKDNNNNRKNDRDLVYAELDMKRLNKNKNRDQMPKRETVYAEVHRDDWGSQDLVYAEINHKGESIYENINRDVIDRRNENKENIKAKEEPIYAVPLKNKDKSQKHNNGHHNRNKQSNRVHEHEPDIVYATVKKSKKLDSLTGIAKNASNNQNHKKENLGKSHRNPKERH